MRGLVISYSRYGYRRLHAPLVLQGFRGNHKRVQRLCRDRGLGLRLKKRKRARLGQSTNPSNALSAARPNQVRALDFQFDQTGDRRVVKYLKES